MKLGTPVSNIAKCFAARDVETAVAARSVHVGGPNDDAVEHQPWTPKEPVDEIYGYLAANLAIEVAPLHFPLVTHAMTMADFHEFPVEVTAALPVHPQRAEAVVLLATDAGLIIGVCSAATRNLRQTNRRAEHRNYQWET